jgi:outer membrane protein, heavy metal efflux system
MEVFALKASVITKRVARVMPLLLVLAPLPARLASAQPYALDQAIEYSLQYNGGVKSLAEEKGIRDAAVAGATVLANPVLEISGESAGACDDNSVSIGISQDLPLAGKREKRLEKARRESEHYQWQLTDRKRTLHRQVAEAFYDVLLARQRLQLADRRVALSRQLLDVTKDRLNSGDIPELEMNLVKVELARSQGARLEAGEKLETLQTALATVMGMPYGEGPAVTGSLENGAVLNKDLAALKQLAREARPDLKSLEAETRLEDAAVTLAKAEAVPDLTAGLWLKREKTSIDVGGLDGKETSYLVGVKLSMPIPLFNRNETAVRQGAARRSSAETRLLATRNAVDWEVESAYASLTNAEKVISLYRMEIVPQLQENLDLTQEAYRLGEVGILAIIEEQKKFFEVSDSYLMALHERQTAFVKLETAVGSSLTGGGK